MTKFNTCKINEPVANLTRRRRRRRREVKFLNAVAFTTILSNNKTNTRYKDQEHLPWSAFTISSSAAYLLCSISFFFILRVPSIMEPTDYDKSSSYNGGCNYF